jgi:hypothetical protein
MAIELINYFEGNWSFTREIKTNKDKLFAIAEGRVSFSKDSKPDCLFYSEDGKLDLKESRTNNLFYKNYIFHFFKDHISVYLSGGAKAEQLYQEYSYKENKLIPIAEHACNRDLYNSEYQIKDEDQFTLVTKIGGPQKDFLIKTIFNRIKTG